MQEQSRFKDGFSAVPIELFKDPALRGDDFAVYAVMKSFGGESRAKVETYAARLGWTAKRVKASQNRLEKAQWIVLLEEGGRVSKSIYKPRLWWVAWNKGEQPPQGEEVGGRKVGPPTNRTPFKKATLSKGGPKSGGAELDKALKTEKVSKTDNKREKEKDNSGKTTLSVATPSDPKSALALLNPAWKAKHGSDLPAAYADQAEAALQVYGDDLLPAWQRYLADDGTQGRVKAWRHPIPLFTSQLSIWGWSAFVLTRPAFDPELRAKQDAQRLATQARTEASHQAQETFVRSFNARPSSERRRSLERVAAISDFMADFVAAFFKRGGDLQPGSAICTELMSLEGVRG